MGSLSLCITLVLLGSAMSQVAPHINPHGRDMFMLGREPYIIGGQDADPGEYPHQIILYLFGLFQCGGSIISDEWILTAAHCVDGFTPSMFSVGVGYTDINSNEGHLHDVDQMIIHEDWSYITSEGDDIALLHLSDALDFSDDNIAPIALAQTGDEFAGADNCYITGWGVTDNGYGENDLQEAEIDVYTLQQCEDKYGKHSIDDDEHVCVGVEGEKGVCSGDSGGPAQCLVDGSWVQIGITSWARSNIFPGCDVNYPSVYTKVAYYNSWINDNCNCL